MAAALLALTTEASRAQAEQPSCAMRDAEP